jgi:integrase
MAGRRLAENMVWSGKHLLPVFGHLRASQVTPELVSTYTKTRGGSVGTVWTELNHLRMTLSWAKKTQMIQDHPAVLLPPRPPPKADYLTKEQAREFIRHLEFLHLRVFTTLALATGARRSAILELTWDQVDLEKRLINFSGEDHNPFLKGRAVAPINDTLYACLNEAKRGASSNYVVEYSGDRVRSVSKGIKAAAVRAGVPFVSPHVFRHSAAVWMAESGVAMEVIAQYLGHTSPEITRRVYARYSPTYLRSAAGALEL